MLKIITEPIQFLSRHLRQAKMDTHKLYKLEDEFKLYLREKSPKTALSTLEKIIESLDEITKEFIHEKTSIVDKTKVLRELTNFDLVTAAYVIKLMINPQETKEEINRRCKMGY